MRKLIYFLLLFGIFVACSSGDNEPEDNDYYIRFKVDGNLMDYNASTQPAGIFFDNNSNIHGFIAVVPKPGSDGLRDFMNITVWNETDFATGVTYQMQNPVTVSGIQRSRVHLTWANEQGQIYNAVLLKSQHPSLVINNDAQARFTEIGQDVIRGTFSGIIIGQNPVLEGNPEFQVTEGEFRLKLIRIPSS